MRTRTWLVAVTVLAGTTGVVVSGCGDDTTPATPPAEAGGGADTGGGGRDVTTTDTGGGTDAAKDVQKEAMACVDAAINVSNFDSGSATWACIQTMCMDGGTLAACAADCTCNTAFATALQCVADGGDQVTCFTPAVTEPTGIGAMWYSQCYTAAVMKACNPDGAAVMTDGGDASTDGGDAGTDGGTDGGSDAGTDGDAGD
jgi:hypothetical protein